MDTVIYSISPLKAFAGGILVVVFLLGLGFIGALWAIFKRKEKMFSRIAMGCASLVLLLAGVGTSIALFMQWQSGSTSVIVHINEKKVVESNCDNSGNTCTSYLLETNAGSKYYDFTVAKDAFDLVEADKCYEFTYYPSKSLFGKYLRGEEDYSDVYETASGVTRIALADCQ